MTNKNYDDYTDAVHAYMHSSLEVRRIQANLTNAQIEHSKAAEILGKTMFEVGFEHTLSYKFKFVPLDGYGTLLIIPGTSGALLLNYKNYGSDVHRYWVRASEHFYKRLYLMCGCCGWTTGEKGDPDVMRGLLERACTEHGIKYVFLRRAEHMREGLGEINGFELVEGSYRELSEKLHVDTVPFLKELGIYTRGNVPHRGQRKDQFC